MNCDRSQWSLPKKKTCWDVGSHCISGPSARTLLLEPPNVGPNVGLMLFVVSTAHVPGCIDAAVLASTLPDCGAAAGAEVVWRWKRTNAEAMKVMTMVRGEWDATSLLFINSLPVLFHSIRCA